MSFFGNGQQRREPTIRMRVPVEGGMEDEGAPHNLPGYLAREVHSRQEDTGPEAYAQPARRRGTDARLAELQRDLAPRLAAPPPPLSEEARRLVSEQDIRRSEAVRDSLRAVAAARLAEFDARAKARREEMAIEAAAFEAAVQDYVKARREESAAEAASFEAWAAERRAHLEDFALRVHAWGDDRVAKVTAEQEERARVHHRDVDIVLSTQALLEKHGVPLPPPRPAAGSSQSESEEHAGAEAGQPRPGTPGAAGEDAQEA